MEMEELPDVSVRELLGGLDWHGVPAEVARRMAEATQGAFVEATFGYKAGTYNAQEYIQKIFTIGMMPAEYISASKGDVTVESMEAFFTEKASGVRARKNKMS